MHTVFSWWSSYDLKVLLWVVGFRNIALQVYNKLKKPQQTWGKLREDNWLESCLSKILHKNPHKCMFSYISFCCLQVLNWHFWSAWFAGWVGSHTAFLACLRFVMGDRLRRAVLGSLSNKLLLILSLQHFESQ